MKNGPLIRPSGTFSRREKDNLAAFSPWEKVAEGRMRGTAHP